MCSVSPLGAVPLLHLISPCELPLSSSFVTFCHPPLTEPMVWFLHAAVPQQSSGAAGGAPQRTHSPMPPLGNVAGQPHDLGTSQRRGELGGAVWQDETGVRAVTSGYEVLGGSVRGVSGCYESSELFEGWVVGMNDCFYEMFG